MDQIPGISHGMGRHQDHSRSGPRNHIFYDVRQDSPDHSYVAELRSTRMKKLIAVIALAIIAAQGAAQDAPKPPTAKIAGNWDFSFTSPQGAANWRIKFEQSGDTLFGTANTDFGAVNVTDGWVTGNDLSFTLNLNIQGQAIPVNFSGTVKGDTAQGQIDVPGVGIQPFPFTAIRAASETAKLHALRAQRLRVTARPE